MNKMAKTLLMFLLVFALLANNGHLPKVSAATQSKTFPESTSRTQTHSLTLPNLKSVDSVSVNTGNVSYSVSGETVTFTFSNGAVSRTVQTGGTYTPADSKTVSTSRTYSASGVCSPPSYPSSIYYSSDGYSGTLSKTSASSSGYKLCEADGNYYPTTATVSYSGTVTRPASDTRTYAYYYQYTVTINYVDNFVPNLTIVSPTNNQTLSEVPGHNKLTISGTVQDTDAGDTLTVKYQIDSATAQSIQTLTATGSSQTINNYDILIDSSISEGNHVLKVWAEDDKGGSSSVVTRNFTVDKTPPAAPTITESPTGNAPNKTITISYSGDTVTKEYQVDSGAWTAYTSPFSITQNGTITARATDAAGNQSTNQLVVSTINPPAPTVTVSGVSNTGFTVTDTGTYTAPVEYQFELYAVGNPTPIATYPSTTTWQDGNSYTFSSLNPNVKYQAKVKVRYK